MPAHASAALMSLALTATLVAPGMLAADRTGPPPAPDMQLRVSTHHGLLPLDLTLEGKIEGFEPSDFATCQLSVEWSYTPPGGYPLTSKKYLPCVDPDAADKVPPAFKRKETLSEAGTYSYRIVMQSKQGKQYASTSQEVKVIKSSLELGVGGTRSDNR